MKTLNATLLAALFAIPAVSFADGGNEPFVNIHSQATASDVRAAFGARGGFNASEANSGLIAINDAAPKTRAQVSAEFVEARRLGLTQGGEQIVVPTIEQQIAISEAGLRAVAGTPAPVNAAVAAVIASPSVAQ
jgi:Domain of unknown function (DUF4148)